MTSMTNGRDLLDFRVHGIRQPMLILWGAQDELIPIKSGETIHKAVPQLHLAVVEGCGHLAPSECSRAVLKATVEFSSRSRRSRVGRRCIRRSEETA